MADVREYAGVPPVAAFADMGAPFPGGSPVVVDSTTGTCYVLVSGVVTAVGGGGVPTQITVANEATDTSCFVAFFTAATGNLEPKTNANLTFNSNTGVLTSASSVLTTTDINGGTIDGAVIGGSSAAAGTFTAFTSNGIDDNATSNAITIDSSENCIIGYTAAVTTSNESLTPKAQLHGISNTPFGVFNWNAGASNPAQVMMMKSRGATPGSFSVVSSGDILGVIQFQGDDGDEFQVAAQIRSLSDGAPGNADMPGNLVFFTVPNASITATEAFRVDSAQLTTFQTDRALRFDNQTSSAGASGGTLLNAPAVGNPGYWLKINIGGTNYAVPCWAG